MRILTESIHTSYDAELALAVRGTEWFGMEFQTHPWGSEIRPVPDNWKRIKSIADAGKVDVILAQSIQGAEHMRYVDVPMIFNQVNDCSEGTFPDWLSERCYAFNFISPEVAERWEMKDDAKKRVIPMAVDHRQFYPHLGDGMGNDILTVGHHICDRWDKGIAALRTFNQVMLRTDLIGPGNGPLACAVGSKSWDETRTAYQHYKVYFNPGPIIGIAVAEAMLAGMPVVTFRPINQRALMLDGQTAFVTDTLDGAYIKIRRLLADPALRSRLGNAGRAAAMKVFDPEARGWEWEQLFREAVATFKPGRQPV